MTHARQRRLQSIAKCPAYKKEIASKASPSFLDILVHLAHKRTTMVGHD
jgi:hypothetical protein